MNKYSDKSDFEINKAVAEITIYGDWYLSPTDERPFTFFNYGINSRKTVELPDYCNNPADAMPIVIDNRITMKPHVFESNYWECAWKGFFMTVDKNPYRAAMEVFLMMKDAE